MAVQRDEFSETLIKDVDELKGEFANRIEDATGLFQSSVFRGQADAEWHLETTMGRLIERARATNAKTDGIEAFQKAHLDRFKKFIRGRRGRNPPRLEDDEAWALGQHYGLATPLLDWTESPYVALFFAFETPHRDAEHRAIWCLDRQFIEDQMLSANDDGPDPFMVKRQIKFLLPDVEENGRLIAQSGLFSKSNVRQPLDKWLAQLFRDRGRRNQAVRRVLVKNSDGMRRDVLKFLDQMNINNATIYPEIEGACRHANTMSEDFWADPF